MADQLDTTGTVEGSPYVNLDGQKFLSVGWAALDAFTQGYIEAALDRPELRDSGCELGFSDLAPETLAQIIADCEAAVGLRVEPTGHTFTNTAQGGYLFWEARQTDNFMGAVGFPPLTVTLGEDGKVRFSQDAA